MSHLASDLGAGGIDSPAASLPAYIRVALQYLPAKVQRLLMLPVSEDQPAGPPLRVPELKGMVQQLEVVKSYLESLREAPEQCASTVTAILDFGGGVAGVALLQLVSYGLHSPLAASSGALAHQQQQQQQGPQQQELLDIVHSEACGLAQRIISGCYHQSRIMDFGLQLVRMETVQACARQLATAAEDLSTAEAMERATAVTRKVLPLLVSLCIQLDMRGGDSTASLAVPLYDTALLAALEDSHVLEHAFRLMMRLAGSQQHRVWTVARAIGRFIVFLPEVFRLCTAVRVGPQLGALLSGPCAQFAALALGLKVLCLFDREFPDGGSMYGLPPEFLRSIPAPNVDSFTSDTDMSETVLSAFTNAVAIRGQAGLLSRRGTLSVLMRVCRLTAAVAASGPVVAVDEGGRLTFPSTSAVVVAVHALTASRAWLRPLGVHHDEGAAAEAEQWWRLALPLLTRRQDLAAAEVLSLKDFGAALAMPLLPDGVGFPPAEPPPAAATALASGLLPSLERLLRRAADSEGSEAAIMSGYLSECRGSWRNLAAMLAYGNPREAAALVMTIGKVLRRLESWFVEPIQRLNAVHVHLLSTATTLLLWCLGAPWPVGRSSEDGPSAGGPPLAVGEAPPPTASGEVPPPPPPPGEAAPEGFPSEAAAQLNLMLSCAAGEWLPAMLGIVKEVLPQDSRPRPGPSGTGVRAESAQWALILISVVAPLSMLFAGGASNGSLGQAAGSSGGSGGSGLQGVKRGLLFEEMRLTRDRNPAQSYAAVVRACTFVALLFPGEVRSAAAAAAAKRRYSTRRGGSRTSSYGSRHVSGSSREHGEGEGAQDLLWSPVLLRDMAAGLRAQGLAVEAAAGEALAAQLEAWAAGQGGEGDVVVDEVFRRDMEALLGGVDVAGSTAPNRYLVLPLDASAARHLARTCAHPNCSRLEGDSELSVKLHSCANCGAVQYCCRECQVAHWRAGHKAACGAG